ncbi:MAG TPA: uroporphyrinogen-III C-methyltransferase [Campylobacterales bacterium]|nr:uroporphyrinogen-III C-methyltransferase [Campylobacterales bacterium]
MATLPITLANLERGKVGLLGGGKVAKHKAEILIRNQIPFTAIAENFYPDFPECRKVEKKIELTDIANFDYIIDATGSDEVGEYLKQERKKRFLLVNRVDNPTDSNFFFNSLIIRKGLKIAVSTSGKSPKMGQLIRNRIEQLIPANFGDLLEKFGKERENGNIDIASIEKETKQGFTKKVYLIGAGTGDPELLTIKAYRTIQTLDTIFYDHLISKEILDLVPKSCRLVSVGKQKGSHSKKQSEINRLIVDEVEKGNLVGRLKAGDPYIFGRGGEEFLHLVQQGIDVEVIPGVSSATSFGLPPTLRGYASGLSIVSAHLAGNRVNLDWVHLLKIENHTIIVLMGLSRVQEIYRKGIELGVSNNLPVLIVSNISRPNEKRVLGEFGNLVSLAKEVTKPAILVFGEVAKLDKQFQKEFYNGC